MIAKQVHVHGDRQEMQVTFVLPNSLWAERVCLVGDFNNWDRCSHPLTRNRKGEWTITISLPLNKAYQFRYLIDGRQWTNDDHADAYLRNYTGSDNFIVITDPEFHKYEIV